MKLKRLLHQLVMGAADSVEVLCARMQQREQMLDPFAPKRSLQVLRNKLNPDSNSHHMTLEELDMLSEFTGADLPVANYFAQRAHAVCVPLPDADFGDMGLLDAFMDVSIQQGNFAIEFQKAWADGNISEHKYQRLHAAIYAGISKQLGLLKEIERLRG